MTVKEKVRKMLVDIGMSAEQADAVLQDTLVEIEKELGPILWDHPADVYLEFTYFPMQLSLYKVSLKYALTMIGCMRQLCPACK